VTAVRLRGHRLSLLWAKPVRAATGRARAAKVRVDGRPMRLVLPVRRRVMETPLIGRRVRLPRRIRAGAFAGRVGTPPVNARRTAPVPVFPDLAPERARPAGDFVDSVGVNVHISYGSTAYGNFPAVRDALVDLGIRHVRDGACAGCRWLFPRYLELGRLGIRFTMIIGSPKNITGTLAANLASIRDRLRPAVEAVEGANEYDGSGDPQWVPALRAYQAELHGRVMSDPALAGLDVLGPSFRSAAARARAGDMSAWMTAGNMHPYAGGEPPGRNLTAELSQAALVAGSRPVVATEAGYHDATRTAGGHRPVDEATAGTYIPTLLLEHFRRGVRRTFLYELVDQKPDPERTNQERHFGLLRSDFTPKPSYTALKALIAAVGDGAPAGRPGTLRYDVAGGDGSVRRLLLARPGGGFSLVLWRDVRVWDTATRKRLRVASSRVTVRLGQSVSGAEVLRRGATVARADAPRKLALSLGADPVVIRLGRPR
jgi:hypothetical protein